MTENSVQYEYDREYCLNIDRGGDIVTYVIHEGTNFDLQFFSKIRSVITKCTSYDKKFLLVDARNFFSVTNSATTSFTSIKADYNIYAIAFVVNELGSLMKLYNLINVFKPAVPIKYFIEEKYALDWFDSIQQ
jgi:hypothetical protein